MPEPQGNAPVVGNKDVAKYSATNKPGVSPSRMSQTAQRNVSGNSTKVIQSQSKAKELPRA